VFVKQLGARPVEREPAACLVEFSFRDSHGGDPSEWAEDLRIREFPEVAHV
jgi:hypothetical protein